MNQYISNNTVLRWAAILLLSVVAAMLVGSLLILAVGADPLQAYYYMLVRPLTSITSIGEVAMYFTPLLLVGLGVSFTFHAKLSNLGGEGQMLFGALGMTLVGVPPVGNLLGVWSLPVGILLGILMGAFWAAAATGPRLAPPSKGPGPTARSGSWRPSPGTCRIL